jgi:hypothetical protein
MRRVDATLISTMPIICSSAVGAVIDVGHDYCRSETERMASFQSFSPSGDRISAKRTPAFTAKPLPSLRDQTAPISIHCAFFSLASFGSMTT